MKYLLLTLIVFISGCNYFNHQKTCRRKIDRIEIKCKDCIDTMKLKVRIDSTIPEKIINSEIPINNVDSSKIKEVAQYYSDSLNNILNSNIECEKKNYLLKMEIKRMEEELPKKLNHLIKSNKVIDTFSLDTAGIQFKIWQQNGKFKTTIRKKSETISLEKEVNTLSINCPDCPELKDPIWYRDFWFWVWLSTVLFFMVIGIITLKIR